MGKVHLYALPTLVESLGFEKATGNAIPDQEIEGEESIRDLLGRLCARYPRFARWVYDVDTRQLTGRVVIFYNGRTLGAADGLENKLSDGDSLTFVSPIEGG